MLSVLAVGAASLALAATAGASSGGGVVVQARDACDPATFPAGLCARTDNSGGAVAFDELLSEVGRKHAHPAWRFTADDVKVRRGTPVAAQFGRGGELHTFTDVTATGFGPGCVDILNELIFGSPALADACNAIDPQAGVPEIFLTTGLFPGRTIPVDTSTPGTHLFQCMIHPWMRTTVTVE
jgi:plastocyanin